MKKKILEIFEKHGFNEHNCTFFKENDIEEIAKEIASVIPKNDIDYYKDCCENNTSNKIDKIVLFKPSDFVWEDGVMVRRKRKYGKFTRDIIVTKSGKIDL